MQVPAIRIREANGSPVRSGGAYVLYWMTASRRTWSNFALDRALEWCAELQRPLLVVEALRCGHPWASDRIHRFVLDGMLDQQRRFDKAGVAYLPWLEAAPGDGRGLIAALSDRAAVVITDDAPVFFLPRMLAAAASRCGVRLEAVDGNGLLPLRASNSVFPTAHAFRRVVQRLLPAHLHTMPRPDPLARGRAARFGRAELPAEVLRRWSPVEDRILAGGTAALANLPIDHGVPPAPWTGGGSAGLRALRTFVADRLARYGEGRNHPDSDATSGLSAWLHFGHLGAHQVFEAVREAESWDPRGLEPGGRGSREGWWRMRPAAEAFLDQVITWRELGFQNAARDPRHDRYEGLPEWSRRTLAAHRRDPRHPCYRFEDLAAAATEDALWNAAQRQLLVEGRIHNYLRMLWGKKVLEWSRSPAEAFETLVELNNRHALDGRDPNSYAGIQWIFGRYDRPWGPERPVFGTVRFMSSAATARKLDLSGWLERWGSPPAAVTSSPRRARRPAARPRALR